MANRNDNFEKAFDILLTEAAENVVLKDGEELLSKEIPEHEFSEKHKKEMEKIFKKDKKNKLLQFVKKHKAFVASFIAVVIALGITLPNVKAIKSVFLVYFFDKDAPGTVIKFDDGTPTHYSNDRVSIRYLPAGFVTVFEEITKPGMTFQFEKDEKWVGVSIGPMTGNLSIDTENAELEEVTVNGVKGLFSIKPNVKILVWNDEKYAYVMDGNLEKEEFIKIAESITVWE